MRTDGKNPVQDLLLTPLPAGRVQLTDARSKRTWAVDVGAFSLGATAVTQEQYAAVTGSRPAAARGDRLPVESVSWWDAVSFCNLLSRQAGLSEAYRIRDGDIAFDASTDGYRLPTEAEWEYACRAGTAGPRYGNLEDIGWYRGNSDGRIHEVGQKPANSWGLHDMLGNVWEWCWDFSDPARYGTYRILRGGGWFDEHWSCRASVRRNSFPGHRIDDVGFRIARGAAGATYPDAVRPWPC